MEQSNKFVTRKSLLLANCVKVHDKEIPKEIKKFSSNLGMKNKFYTFRTGTTHNFNVKLF